MKWLRVRCAIDSGNNIFIFVNLENLQIFQIYFFTERVVEKSDIFDSRLRGNSPPSCLMKCIFCLRNRRASDFKLAELKKAVKRSSRRIGVNLQLFGVKPTSLGAKRGEQPFFRQG